jgi:hypothetical protein
MKNPEKSFSPKIDYRVGTFTNARTFSICLGEKKVSQELERLL